MSVSGATGLAITNPLVKYRALIATKAILPDPAQHRLALHLQKLYEHLKDYEPQLEYSRRLDELSRALSNGVNAPTRSSWGSLLTAKEKRDSLALTRKLTSHESALQLDSPKGLMLHGEVGTGKSMLVDLFADCLPTLKKRRWHFTTFMLEAFAKLESFRRARADRTMKVPSVDDAYSMLWLAKEMIQTSPIVFLDEFQLPDRAASKIMTVLLTSFFQLGGVLIATSNRMSEELAKAAGIEFAPPPSRLGSLSWQFGLRRRSSGASDRLFGGQNEFASFLEVLKVRCEVWEMEGAKDYRRSESGSVAPNSSFDSLEGWQLDGHNDMQHSVNMPACLATEAAAAAEADASAETMVADHLQAHSLPKHYIVKDEGVETTPDLDAAVAAATGTTKPLEDLQWSPRVMNVYGRSVAVPRALDGVTYWTFAELCKTALGPADYVSLASSYHTLILTDVPVLTWLTKNEARRFITVLDALYECRCKLIISAAAGPDDLFFPEKADKDGGNEDAVYAETFAEAYQDATAPFRPNILSQNPNYAEPDPEPDYTHARLAGLLNADQLEDDPPNKARGNPFGRSFGRTDSEMERRPIDPDEPRYNSPDFAKAGAFTGEDERFAYRRAQSRLWEMCGAKWWARNEPDWHRPLPQEVRRWEQSRTAAADPPVNVTERRTNVAMGDATVDETRDERMFKHNASPFRMASEPPPKFSWTHIWGTMKWGPKAGAWGQGVEGLKARGDGKK